MLTVPSYLLLHVWRSVLQDDSLHDFSRHQREALFPWVDFLCFFEDGCNFLQLYQ